MQPQQPREGYPSVIADFTVVQRGPAPFLLVETPERLGGEGRQLLIEQTTDAGLAQVAARMRSIAAVRSEHLVPLVELGQHGEFTYLAMRAPAAGSLAAPERQLTFAEVLRALADAARGAHALHEHGMTHGAICPGRVLLLEHGAALAPPPFGDGDPAVDPTFLDPAALRGEDAGRAGDLHSLGATLHFAAAGHSLYPQADGASAEAARAVVLQSTPQVDPSLPAPVAALVRQCVDPTAPDRPSTTAELAESLDALWRR